MTFKIDFDGFVQEVKELSWGKVVVVAHSIRAKDESGVWSTVGKDYVDVTLADGVPEPLEGALVRVQGSLRVKPFLKKNGEAGVSLQVRAVSVDPVAPGGKSHTPAAKAKPSKTADWVASDAVPLDEAPF